MMAFDLATLCRYSAAKIIAIDTETTGLNPGRDEVLSLSIVDARGNPLFNHLIRPTKRKRWPKAQEINGISPADVKDEKTLIEYSDELGRYFDGSCVIVGYNIAFDLDMLACNGLNIDKLLTFDVMNEAAKVFGRRVKLTECAARLGYGEFPAHGSFQDARATMACFINLVQMPEYRTIVESDSVVDTWEKPESVIPDDQHVDARDYTPNVNGGTLSGEVVCITGTCPTMTRAELMAMIADHGGTPCNNVTLKTTILAIFNAPGMSKYEKAVKYGPRTGIRIMEGPDFMAMMAGKQVDSETSERAMIERAREEYLRKLEIDTIKKEQEKKYEAARKAFRHYAIGLFLLFVLVTLTIVSCAHFFVD